MFNKKNNKKLSILETLKQSAIPLSGKKITGLLGENGICISERTVRLYLLELDSEGLTRQLGKKGRIITSLGLQEIGAENLLERVGFMSARIDQATFKMNFDLYTRSGTVIVNTTIIDREILLKYLDKITAVFEKGFAMGTLVGLLNPGENTGNITIPEGKTGLCTVCSVTLNGVLLKHGVPAQSIFSGLLEFVDSKPRRFVELIHYNGSSINPLSLFIRSGMTNYLGVISSGNGLIGAGFREIPADSYELVVELADKLDLIGLGAFQTIGKPGMPLYNIPVKEGCSGVVVIGGLNPTAVFEESGVRLDSFALSGLMDFSKLFPYTELKERLLSL